MGVAETVAYHSVSFRLGPDETLLLYTDGVTDAVNPAREMFGEKRFLALAAEASAAKPAEAQRRIFAALADFRGAAEQFDDITLLLFRLLR